MVTSRDASPIADEWLTQHFDHMAPKFGATLHESLGRLREVAPVAHSDQHGGFWVVSRYKDVKRVAQDWETFSSSPSVAVPPLVSRYPNIPVEIDPPLQREYKLLINRYLTPPAVASWEAGTREFAVQLIDRFVDSGRIDFMTDFARPFPAVTFFELVLNAPSDDIDRLVRTATLTTQPQHPDSPQSWVDLAAWINDFIDQRKAQAPMGDLVDGVINAEIAGRPITRDETVGIIQLLILGGLETTGGALGHMMLHFCRNPEIPRQLREDPDSIPAAIEELLRLDAPMVTIGRRATKDTEIGGQQIKAGDRVLMYWASANRDEDEFTDPHTFDLARANKRHVTFGLGPHRCVGSNLARMNLRVALEELLPRLHDIRLEEGTEIRYHSIFNRAPLAMPITFTGR